MIEKKERISDERLAEILRRELVIPPREIMVALRELLSLRKQVASMEPSGYAYRYADGYIRFNNGHNVNGGGPTEAIPYYFGAALPSPPKQASSEKEESNG